MSDHETPDIPGGTFAAMMMLMEEKERYANQIIARLERLESELPGRRERIATAVLAGLLANPTIEWDSREQASAAAVKHADILIAALDSK